LQGRVEQEQQAGVEDKLFEVLDLELDSSQVLELDSKQVRYYEHFQMSPIQKGCKFTVW